MATILEFLFDVLEWLWNAYEKIALVSFIPLCAVTYVLARQITDNNKGEA